eukprot:3361-Heterococcus_DN1.PRE.4
MDIAQHCVQHALSSSANTAAMYNNLSYSVLVKDIVNLVPLAPAQVTRKGGIHSDAEASVSTVSKYLHLADAAVEVSTGKALLHTN